MVQFTIPGTLPSLNEYVRACRSNIHAGSKMSREAHYLCRLGMVKLVGHKINRVYIKFCWIEKNKRRDKDNIAFAKKFILDALQEVGILRNDGWSEIIGFSDTFAIDKESPRVEVFLMTEREVRAHEQTEMHRV
ncbi:hypothetical protein [uncultured Megasphaera sp.]|uniref:hypothetical protein n=1 Tax=uncultured Megasphaera sp. TaxID=165188 RepID=UPI00266C2844|nr:hypothetical protein [uncultured Megasphaera sp.]